DVRSTNLGVTQHVPSQRGVLCVRARVGGPCQAQLGLFQVTRDTKTHAITLLDDFAFIRTGNTNFRNETLEMPMGRRTLGALEVPPPRGERPQPQSPKRCKRQYLTPREGPFGAHVSRVRPVAARITSAK